MKLGNMRFNFSKLNQPIEIFEVKPVNDDGMPGKPEPVTFLKCFAHVESVGLKDYETSVQMGTEHQIKAFVRNYPGITNKMKISHFDDEHNIKQVLYDYRQSGFSIIIAEEVSR